MIRYILGLILLGATTVGFGYISYELLRYKKAVARRMGTLTIILGAVFGISFAESLIRGYRPRPFTWQTAVGLIIVSLIAGTTIYVGLWLSGRIGKHPHS